jgi:spore coat polysaccharide biosynthesis protein SpsF
MQAFGLRDSSETVSVMAFLQARMGSTRLPGKVLMQIHGKSMLERAILRLRAAAVVQEVVVLTTDLDQDDAVAREASRLGAPVYRGSEDDVLLRFQDAAELFKPEIIIRATADNPLIDIGSVDRIVRALVSAQLDYCMERDLPYGAATEACTAAALAKTHVQARDPRDREHVTLYIKEHSELFQVAFLEAPENLHYPELRVTVDTAEDIAFMRSLIAVLPEIDGPIPLKDYLPFTPAFNHAWQSAQNYSRPRGAGLA